MYEQALPILSLLSGAVAGYTGDASAQNSAVCTDWRLVLAQSYCIFMLSESLRTQFLIATILLHATQYVLFLVRPCHQGPLFSDYRCCLGTGAAGWGCFRSRRVPRPDGEPAVLGPQVPWAVGAIRCDRAAAKSAMMASM